MNATGTADSWTQNIDNWHSMALQGSIGKWVVCRWKLSVSLGFGYSGNGFIWPIHCPGSRTRLTTTCGLPPSYASYMLSYYENVSISYHNYFFIMGPALFTLLDGRHHHHIMTFTFLAYDGHPIIVRPPRAITTSWNIGHFIGSTYTCASMLDTVIATCESVPVLMGEHTS